MQEYQDIIDKIKPELEKTIRFLEGELAKIRTSRATPSLVENIEVECFGQKFLLKQLGSISIPKSREILIQPWDKSYIEPIEKAISRSSLGVNPVVDGEIIRIFLPPISAEFRESLLKLVSQKREEARQTIRKWRGEVWDLLQDLAMEGKISEDDKYRGKDKLQELVDEYNEKVDELVERKKKEIME
ncbi:ribosome recycling factor [bacterium]|nr:ribosome recycling factor [bacterium]